MTVVLGLLTNSNKKDKKVSMYQTNFSQQPNNLYDYRLMTLSKEWSALDSNRLHSSILDLHLYPFIFCLQYPKI